MSWAPGERSGVAFQNVRPRDDGTTEPLSPEPSGPKPAFTIPRLELPKGGGAIRGIGESFRVNAINGTPTLSFPLPSTRARGFDAGLSLTYDSGLGADIFGWGWTLDLPSIRYKTDRGLPYYMDSDSGNARDIFQFAGEDLVPLRAASGAPVVDERDGYVIRRYAPRIERQFSRIERWTHKTTGEQHWLVTSSGNVTSVYGPDAASRIAGRPRQHPTSATFAWLLRERLDDRGNRLRIDYKREDDAGVDASMAAERRPADTLVQAYPKRVRYGNATPGSDDFMFELVFDYGDHDQDNPTPAESRAWTLRPDPFSTYRAGFEIRTRRFCQRVLLFHRFPDELGEPATLVNGQVFAYRLDAAASLLTSITPWSFAKTSTGARAARALPPLQFTYSLPPEQWADVKPVDDVSLQNLPAGLDDAGVQWVDLFGDALPGALIKTPEALLFKPNVSPLTTAGGNDAQVRIGAAQTLSRLPQGVTPELQLLDIDGDGRSEALSLDSVAPGYLDLVESPDARPLTPFPSAPRIDWRDPSLRLLDLTGDGLPDLVITEQDQVAWHSGLGTKGFAAACAALHADSEELAPVLVFHNAEEMIFTADMSGDGLPDLVRIRAREVCYWPNLGYGHFGAKRAMDAAPPLDRDAPFDAERVRLIDTDGSGTADLVYLDKFRWSVYRNCTGTRFAEGRHLDAVPHHDALSQVQACDLLGNGTACLVWSSRASDKPMRYVALVGDDKPYLLTATRNNLGAETRITYATSTRFLLEDRLQGSHWVTRLPFPVNVVERVETRDLVNGHRFATRYAYHHGYFDGVAREFRGFGYVEQWDTEEDGTYDASEAANFVAAASVPPVLTRRWYHIGLPTADGDMGALYARDYFGAPATGIDPTWSDLHRRTLLSSAVLPPALATPDWREACRALKGSLLREEVYGLDGTAAAAIPYTIHQYAMTVQVRQSARESQHAICLVLPRETLNLSLERSIAAPRIAQDFTTRVDTWGNALERVAIAFGRPPLGDTPVVATQAVLTQADMTNAVDLPSAWRLPAIAETRGYELGGLGVSDANWPLAFDTIAALAIAATALTPTDTVDPNAAPQKRLLQRGRTRFRRDDLTGPAAWGELPPRALPYESYALAFTAPLLQRLFNGAANAAMLSEGGYVDLDGDGNSWAPSGRVYYERTAEHPEDAANPAERDARAAAERTQGSAHFFLPRATRDQFGAHAFVDYDPHYLVPVATTDPVGNVVGAAYDYRVLAPRETIDPNGNRARVAFDVFGHPSAIAMTGKDGEGLGETLADADSYLAAPALNFLALTDPVALQAQAAALLGPASSRALYDVAAFKDGHGPVRTIVLTREMHAADLPAGQASRVRIAVTYTDGLGRMIQGRTICEPGPLTPGGPDVPMRWIVSGWTILNNKGAVVRQYEPFFRDTPTYEGDIRIGKSSIVFYDPLLRRIGTLRPDGTLEKIRFDAWQYHAFDANDCVRIDAPETDPDIGPYVARLDPSDRGPTWYTQRIGGGKGPFAQQAAQKAEAHRDTPRQSFIDASGRVMLVIANLDGAPVRTVSAIDIAGLERETRDPLGRIVGRRDYDLFGRLAVDESLDGGVIRTLFAIDGGPIRTWDSRGHVQRLTYDAGRRPLDLFIADAGGEYLRSRKIYGEAQGAAQNLRGREYQVFDGAGVLTNLAYDFKGNLVHSRRQFAKDHTQKPDWANTVLADESFEGAARFDAVGRQIQIVAPRSSRPGAPINVAQPHYNEAGRLNAISVWLGAVTVPTSLLDPATATRKAVEAVTYDAKGQRTQIRYGNGVTSTYRYDAETHRLDSVTTTRGSAFAGDQPGGLQALSYTYDPVGNVTHIEDTAQPTIIFAGAVVKPEMDYQYDSLYRLTQAKGREHRGNTNQSWPSDTDSERWVSPIPTDPQLMRNYTQTYSYDLVGNFMEIKHAAGGSGWTRSYVYNEPSPFEPGKKNNRLTRTEVGANGQPATESFAYDASGHITQTARLAAIVFDDQDRMQSASLGGGGNVYYVYDGSGLRARKIVERPNAGGGIAFREERIYFGGFELFRRLSSTGTITRERETLRIDDGGGGSLLDIETRTIDVDGSDPAPARAWRWQLDNHIGSAVLELDENAAIVSYEEYHPFGSTSLGAIRAATETPKRYRYTGRERDDESGFYYHRARYYMPWNGRWTACDPAGRVDGLSAYVAWRCNPIKLVDPNGTKSKEAQKAWEEANRIKDADLIGEVYKNPEDVPKHLEEPKKPSADRVLQQQRRLRQGQAKKAQEKKDAAEIHRVTKEEKWEAAKSGGEKWLMDKGISLIAGHTPFLKEGLHLALDPLGPKPPVAHPTTVEQLEIKENFEGMQTTLTAVEVGVSVVAPMVAETALEQLAGAGGGAIPPIEPPLEPPAPPPPPQNPFEFMGELETMGGELQGQVNQVYAQVQPYMGWPTPAGNYIPRATQVGGATTIVNGERITAITFSNPGAHELVTGGHIQLPPGTQLGPPPIMAGSRLAIQAHVERSAILPLQEAGAGGGLTTSSGAACERCAQAWFEGQFPNWIHMNWANYGFGL
ncbi:SpvB/TcaC N-terminal domain-containing protein [Sinorhizobium meliloti]|uniref:SpvB/TcaC N-terminal domain-containing protein n=1 Tax=Rhizobium meliloti TaxID=382 RepID=UPI00398D14F4